MSLEQAQLAKKAAQSKQASNVVILDVTGKSDICDYQLICSGDSNRQTVAIAENIAKTLKEQMNILPLAVEGKAAGHWIAIDYGNMIIHVFLQQLRDFYAIEEIWPRLLLDSEPQEAEPKADENNKDATASKNEEGETGNSENPEAEPQGDPS